MITEESLPTLLEYYTPVFVESSDSGYVIASSDKDIDDTLFGCVYSNSAGKVVLLTADLDEGISGGFIPLIGATLGDVAGSWCVPTLSDESS
jgi:hypothetical protein